MSGRDEHSSDRLPAAAIDVVDVDADARPVAVGCQRQPSDNNDRAREAAAAAGAIASPANRIAIHPSAGNTTTVLIRTPQPTFSTVDAGQSLLNLNGYASKKSLAQGMLDLALLAANAAQLKFVLTAGAEHPFYTLLLVLVCLSICLQVLQVISCLVLGLILDINKVDEQRRADIINNISVAIIVLVVTLNVVISAFDMRASAELAARMLVVVTA